MTKKEALERCILFENASDKTKNQILNDTRTVFEVIETGQCIFIENSGAEQTLCILAEGTLTVFREHNGSRVLLNEIKAPGIVGAASLFGEKSFYHTTVKAKKRCQVLLLQQSQMNELIKSDGEFAMNYIRFLSDRIRFLNKRIASFTSGDAVSRLSVYLLNRQIDGKCEISRARLATELDIGRASLYRALDTLTQQGIVETDGKTIIILDEEKLKSFIQDR